MIMRDPKRIRKICDLIYILWRKFPDLRFWQLITLLYEGLSETDRPRDPFFLEDNIWEQAIKDAIEKN